MRYAHNKPIRRLAQAGATVGLLLAMGPAVRALTRRVTAWQADLGAHIGHDMAPPAPEPHPDGPADHDLGVKCRASVAK